MNLFHADLDRMKGSLLFIDGMKDAASSGFSLLLQHINIFHALLFHGPFTTQSCRIGKHS
jgi:hypothetical protein